MKGEGKMKYSIDGISKERTIKSVDVVKMVEEVEQGENSKEQQEQKNKRIIVVNYLDGTQDIFDFSLVTLRQIEDIMLAQGKKYVAKGSKKIFLNSNIHALFAGMAVLSGGAAAFVASPLVAVALGVTAISCGTAAVVGHVKKQDYKKYEFFFRKVADKLDDYKKILATEQEIAEPKSTKSTKMTGIRQLDNTSMRSLETIVTKVERYHEIEKGRQKVKTL